MNLVVRKSFLPLLLCLVGVTAVGCGSPSTDVPIASILPIERIEPLQVPSEITQDKATDIYRDPGLDPSFDRQLMIPAPRQLIAAREDISVRLIKLGDLAWIAIELEPSSVWPLLVTYWRTSAGGIRSADHTDGTIRRGEYQAADGSRRRSTIRLEGSFRAGTSEVQIFEYQRNGGDWELLSIDTSPASELVSLTRYITQVTAESTPSSLIARALDENYKASLDNSDQDEQKLVLEIGMSRAWATVLRSLGELNIPVISRDQSTRTMLVGASGAPDSEDQPTATLRFTEEGSAIVVSKGDYANQELADSMVTLFADIIATL